MYDQYLSRLFFYSTFFTLVEVDARSAWPSSFIYIYIASKCSEICKNLQSIKTNEQTKTIISRCLSQKGQDISTTLITCFVVVDYSSNVFLSYFSLRGYVC